jgi:hypothetical protein
MDINTILCNLVKTTNANFTFYGKSIGNQEVFAHNGLLPSIAQRADKKCSFSFGYGIGATFVEDETATLGFKVQFDEITPDVLRLVYLYDAILAIIDAAEDKQEVALDDLIYD